MNKEELLSQLAERKATKIKYNWSDFIQAMQYADQDKKDVILKALRDNNDQNIGIFVLLVVNQDKKSKAKNSVEGSINGNKIDIDTLMELLT
jgi:hypothetical protein